MRSVLPGGGGGGASEGGGGYCVLIPDLLLVQAEGDTGPVVAVAAPIVTVVTGRATAGVRLRLGGLSLGIGHRFSAFCC